MLARSIIIFVVAAVLISALPVAAATMKDTPDVVATVNGDKITKQMLADIMFDWDAAMTLEEVLDQRIVGQEARKAGVVVTVAEIKAKIDEIKQKIPPGQTFEEALRGIGMTPGHYFARVKFQLQMEGILKKQIKVTDEDLSGYIKCSHILIRVPYTQDPAEKQKKDDEAKAKIEQIAKEIQDGLDFGEAAKKYSDDTGNKEKGGDLGYFPKNTMDPAFEEAAFKLKPGEVSGVVKTNFGYHLIKMIAYGKDATGAERVELVDKITQQRLGEKWQDWLLGVKNAAKIDNKLAPPKESDSDSDWAPVQENPPPAPSTKPSADKAKPGVSKVKPGPWSTIAGDSSSYVGRVMFFYVGKSGTSLTSSGSTLDKGSSLFFHSGERFISYSKEIKIGKDGTFTFESGGESSAAGSTKTTVKGKFVAADQCVGTITEDGQTTEWTAHPWVSPTAPANK